MKDQDTAILLCRPSPENLSLFLAIWIYFAVYVQFTTSHIFKRQEFICWLKSLIFLVPHSLGLLSRNKNRWKGNGAGLARESQSHCFADQYGKLYTHSFGTDTHTHDVSALWEWAPLSPPCVRIIVEYSEQGTGYTGNRILSTGYLNRGNFPYFQFDVM